MAQAGISASISPNPGFPPKHSYPGSTHLIVRNSHQFQLLTLGSTYVRRTTSTSTSVCPIHPLNPLFFPAYPSLLISNTLSTLSALLSPPHTLLLCYPLFTLPSILFLTLSYRSHSPRFTLHTPGNTYATMPACATPRSVYRLPFSSVSHQLYITLCLIPDYSLFTPPYATRCTTCGLSDHT